MEQAFTNDCRACQTPKDVEELMRGVGIVVDFKAFLEVAKGWVENEFRKCEGDKVLNAEKVRNLFSMRATIERLFDIYR